MTNRFEMLIEDEAGNIINNPEYEPDLNRILGKQKDHNNMDMGDIQSLVFKLIRFYYYGISPKDLATRSAAYGVSQKELTFVMQSLLRMGTIKFVKSTSEYRTINDQPRKRTDVYISINPLINDTSPVSRPRRYYPKNNALLMRLITAYPRGIKDSDLRKAYKRENGDMSFYNDGIKHLLNTGKIKENDKPSIGKIKTIYTAT